MSTQLSIGSLFSGMGGLDLAVEHVFNARTLWQCEWEDAPSAILARHWPDVPNHRDVTAVDWAELPPVDIITGGFPCQDVSLAGRRAGMTEGTRSNLWGAMRSAIEIIRPAYVVAENVRGLLSAKADSACDLESEPGLLGDGSGGHLRALGRVLGDLADLGYDAQWHGLRASDIGAPHHRFRVFILATRRDIADALRCRGRGRGAVPGARPCGEPDTPAHRADSRHGGPGADVGLVEGVADRDGLRSHGGGSFGIEDGRGEPPHGGDHAPHAGSTALREQPGGTPAEEAGPHGGDGPGDPHGERTTTDWGPYAAAIHRWESVMGRRAPAPTVLANRGKHRLSPRFTEFMMGLPDGWVTDTPGIKRNQALKMCGNGVVPQQAAAALHHMLATNGTTP